MRLFNAYYSPALDTYLVVFVVVLLANKRVSGLWFAPSEWKEYRTGIQVLPLLPIEFENKLKERTQMFRKLFKNWDPGIKFFLLLFFLDNTLRTGWFLKE